MSYDSRYDCPQTYLKPYWGFYEFAAAVLELCENPSMAASMAVKSTLQRSPVVNLQMSCRLNQLRDRHIYLPLLHFIFTEKKSARAMYKYLLSKRIK